MSFMTKPIVPTARIPSTHILMESQSSVLLGFLANLSSLEQDSKKDLNPKPDAPNWLSSIITLVFKA